MKFFSCLRHKINFNHRIRNVRSKCTRAAVLKIPNEPLVIEDFKIADKLKEGQLRIAVKYCAVNMSDALICSGSSEMKPNLPIVPGFEIVGEVIESKAMNSCDEEEDITVGDRVLVLNKEIMGGFAEECIVHEKDVFGIPSELSYESAVSIGDSYATALIGLARRANLKKDQTVLVTAAAGGLGLAAVDIAANMCKAKVIGACRLEKNTFIVRDKGAFISFEIKNPESLCKRVLKETEGKGVDVVFDAVGGEIFPSALDCVGHEGKVVVAGFNSLQLPQLNINELLRRPSFSLIGVSLNNYRTHSINIYRQSVKDVLTMCKMGMISPNVSETLKLEQVNEALEHFSTDKSSGKIILKVAD
ncbi:Alcohol dehydrogenase, C-terminal,NAD(P)-binding domain,GroES-like,Polyketide synthase, enoylreductase [Cinara cedri]|uniref:Alcohol dehydrogenase, C-terminal,NAD(P)-binding domain,GroES-like,Polyketide synthase, enoylreductase n=1 Tax=Cinara cedri TaxID=506608 RepID=A0A5E4MJW9_9HEMI|nr:Alcohol dehydrogenase, C-terminal,NAD(P)-binding domain,GroES-like,Polyketide synthase, enoylreductase [Cinara cedri]